jgi:hypothetical protein
MLQPTQAARIRAKNLKKANLKKQPHGKSYLPSKKKFWTDQKQKIN